MELPGMSEQDIDVELLENAVKIHGEKKDERETKEHNFHRMERTFGSFERVVPLPVKINREEVKAQVRNGVLTVVLPKAEPAMGQQKIPVMGA
jgi:HSP20 family protein